MSEKVLLKVENLEQHFKIGKATIKAVDGVSFEVKKGEVFGLVGESGCGKTTTGRSIIRLYDITGGSVYFDGKRICAGIKPYKREIAEAKKAYKLAVNQLNAEFKAKSAGMSPEELVGAKEALKTEIKKHADVLIEVVEKNTALIKKAKYDHENCNKEYAKFQMENCKAYYEPKLAALPEGEEKVKLEAEFKKALKLASKDRIMNKIQMIFQDPIASLDPRMTVHAIISEGLIIRGVKDKEFINKEVYRVLELVGLVPEHASRYPHEFSGGQRQRIGIARAIILNPELIIADEPISALDVSIQAQVINLLNELREKMGLTILFIAHDLSVVKYFSDRIAVMYFGKIVELASSDELFAHPLHPYTKSLLSAIPLPDPHYEKQRVRVHYNPLMSHDYSKEAPTMREIAPGHFIRCNSAEFEKYQQEIKEN